MEVKEQEPVVISCQENNDSDNNNISHFFLTQIQTLILAIFITAMMQYSNHLAVYLIYCCPMYFFTAIIQYFIFWRPKDNMGIQFNIYNLIMFLICLPIFFGVFFGVFHPTASVEFKQAQNCQIIGQLSNSIEQAEKYSIFYVNFEYEGKQYLGQSCSSDLYQEKPSNVILPYKFYYKYDPINSLDIFQQISCGLSNTNKTDPQYQYGRLLQQNYQNQTENLRNLRILRRGSVRSRSFSGGSKSRTCTNLYRWSKVKIASWLCEDRDNDIETYIEPRSCFVNFFTGDKAVQSGQKRETMRNLYNFPLIAYKQNAYYPEADLICLIIFTYYNWILSFNLIFQCTASFFLKKIKNFNNLMVVPLQIKQNELQPIQQDHSNKEKRRFQTHQIQIYQQQMSINMSNQGDQMVQSMIPLDQFQQSFYSSDQKNSILVNDKDGNTKQNPQYQDRDPIL